jgi:TolB-like protein/class 3 adenylate cyclase
MERKLAAILAADVVGYSRLMEHNEADTFERLRAHRKDLFEPEIEKHHGRIFKLMGDGLLAEFGSVVDAVECAVVLQRSMAERNAAVEEERRIDVRIGINLGEVIVEGEDRYGEGVNIAARLQELADPGGICVSGKVSKEVEKKLAFGFEPIGEQQVKNIAEPVTVYRVLLEGARTRSPISAMLMGSRRRRMGGIALATALLIVVGALVWNEYLRQTLTALPLPDNPSVAVLPFDNLSDDPARDRLADGLTEDVITNLSLSRDLFVIARNSTLTYKHRSVDTRQIGRELGVKYVLEGSIQASSGRARITAQLIEAATGRHVWSNRYDRPLEDIFAVQDEVTQAIAGTLLGYEGAVAEAERAIARRKPPADLRAYDYYLLGIEAKHKETKEDNIKAQELLRKALELDPKFARAYVGLAWTYGYEIWLDYTESRARSLHDWVAAAQKALALDPYDGEAHIALGYAYRVQNDYERATPELDRGIELYPNSPDLLMEYAENSPELGDTQKGVELVERAIRLNPNYPAWYLYGVHRVYYFAGKFEKALAAARRAQALSGPLLAAIYGQLGRSAEAAEAARKVLEVDPDWSAERAISETGSFARQAELDLYLDGIRKAGLPVCASAKALQQWPEMKRLPVCEQARATN